MKKLFFILLVMPPVLLPAQNIVDEQLDSANIKRMVAQGYCRQSTYSVYNGYKTLGPVKEVDRNGYLVMRGNAFAGGFNKTVFENDKQGVVVKRSVYNNKDTTQVKQWYSYEKNPAGNVEKVVEHKPGNKTHLERIDSIKHSGKDVWVYSYEFSSYPGDEHEFDKSAVRTRWEEGRYLMTDYVTYDEHDSIKKVETYYAKYDSLGHIVEEGKMDYAEAVYKYYGERRLNITELMFYTPQFIFHMQLDRELEEDKEYSADTYYYYDSLGRIASISGAGGKKTYTYNEKGQLAEMNIASESKPLRVKYEYDSNGLLTREVLWLLNENRIYSEQVYEYAACK